MDRLSPVLVLALALALAAAAPAAAQAPVGSEFQVDSYIGGAQFFATPTLSPGGVFGVVWDSFGQDGSGDGTFGQRYTPDGLRAGGEFQVNTYTTGNQGAPDAAVLANGDLLIVYRSAQNDGVFARRFIPSAGPRGPEFQVNTVPASNTLPAVAADGRGGFVVAWERLDGSGNGIFARRFDRAGEAIGGEFQANTYTTGPQVSAAVAATPEGAFSIFWTSVGTQDGSQSGIFGQRYGADGARLGAEFRVNSYTMDYQSGARAAADRQGRITVVWQSFGQDQDTWGIFGRRFDAAGNALGPDFQVNTYTPAYQIGPDVAADEAGNFVVVWENPNQGAGVLRARRFDAQGQPRSAEFPVAANPSARMLQGSVASDRYGNFLFSWHQSPVFNVFARRFGWIVPAALSVDAVAEPTSNGNRVLEPCETVSVDTTWRNWSGVSQTLSGGATFSGPPGPTYQLVDGTAAYGTVANGTTGSCRANNDCFLVSIACPVTRPSVHWDAVLSEQIAPAAEGQTAEWKIHVGESFGDVPKASPFYGSVETLLHNGVVTGCTGNSYCPAAPATREQMAIFVLVGKEGPAIAPPACGATTTFTDVPASSPFCRWVEELARRGVVGGCAPGLYCPQSPVTREQMAVFVLRVAVPALTPPPCVAGAELFADVPASSPFCPWIEELVRRGVTAGCGSGNYCPQSPVTREQMAVFIVFTFGLGWGV